MRRSVLRRPAVLLASAAFVLAACGGSDDAADSTAGPATADTAASVDSDPSVTEAPVETDTPTTAAPVETDLPATEVPVETEPPVSEPPVTEPNDTPDIELTEDVGPYQVGVQTITLADTSGAGRDLTVDVWFPIDQDIDLDSTLHQYTLVPGNYYESPKALDAGPEVIAPDGPFPLVVYSHGSGGTRFIHSNYTEALASNGYIVAAADHIGNTALDQAATPEERAVVAYNRPNDVKRVIDAFLDPESTETVGYVANVLPDQIAVTGHSFGGFTAYAMASGFTNEIGAFAADDRVDAIIPLAPAASEQLLSDELLASITIPALVLGATDDATTPIDPNVIRPWELSASAPSYRVDLTAAEHETFTDLCAYIEFIPTLPDASAFVVDAIAARDQAGCDADDMPIERAQAITNTFAVTFLDSIFKGGDPIALDQVDQQMDLTYYVK